jgi:hypothetical protein
MTPGHLAPKASGLAHFVPIWSNAQTIVWHRRHMPTGRSRLLTFNSALFDIIETRARTQIEHARITDLGARY